MVFDQIKNLRQIGKRSEIAKGYIDKNASLNFVKTALFDLLTTDEPVFDNSLSSGQKEVPVNQPLIRRRLTADVIELIHKLTFRNPLNLPSIKENNNKCKADGTHTDEFLVSEGNNSISREVVILGADLTLEWSR